MATIDDLVKNLYLDMKENISFIDYKFEQINGKTDLYQYLENHKNEEIIKPDFLENINLGEFVFEGIRYVKLSQENEKVRRKEGGEGRGYYLIQSVEIYNMAYSVYFSLKK